MSLTVANISARQQEDMVLFAKLILSLCCNNPAATNHVQKSLDTVNKTFSMDIRNVIHYLMKPPGPMKASISRICGDNLL